MGTVNVVVDGQNIYTGVSSATPTTFTTGIKGAFFTTGGNMGAIQVTLGVATNTAVDTTVFAAAGSLGKNHCRRERQQGEVPGRSGYRGPADSIEANEQGYLRQPVWCLIRAGARFAGL